MAILRCCGRWQLTLSQPTLRMCTVELVAMLKTTAAYLLPQTQVELCRRHVNAIRLHTAATSSAGAFLPVLSAPQPSTSTSATAMNWPTLAMALARTESKPRDLMTLGPYVLMALTGMVAEMLMRTCMRIRASLTVFQTSRPEMWILVPLSLAGSSRRTRRLMICDSRGVK